MIKITEEDGVTVITPQVPVLDASNGNDFKQEMQDALRKKGIYLIDLSFLTFTDSSGCGAIKFCRKKADETGSKIALCSVNTTVQAIFRLIQMHRLLPIYATREEACQALLED